MSRLPLTNYPIREVHSQEGKLDYYYTQQPSEHANELLPRVATFLQAFAHPSSWHLRSSRASSGLCHNFRPKLHFPAKYSSACGGCHNTILGEGPAGPLPIWILARCNPRLSGGEARGPVSHIWTLDVAMTWSLWVAASPTCPQQSERGGAMGHPEHCSARALVRLEFV
jgi:hypothetical protein